MILRAISKPLWASQVRLGFASAAAIDYYSLLGISRGATREQIGEAYARATRNVDPDSNPALFNRISQAFVILNDIKARDAYDSLMKSRRFSYINEPETKEKPNSYLADRKEMRRKQMNKEFNLDKFGRYRGGLPNPKGRERGKAEGEIGTIHNYNHFQYDKDSHPEFDQVNASIAESFKNFHQNEREYRTRKKTWMTMEVDYDFFTFKKTRKTYWTFIRFTVFLFVLLPIFARFEASAAKRYGKYQADKEAAEKAERKRKAQEEAEKEKAAEQA